MHERVSGPALSADSAQGRSGLGALQRPDWAALREALLEEACGPYRKAGHFAYHFARGKLRHDPVFRAILEHGLLRGQLDILDLGCGQGLLAAWLLAAVQCHERGVWPWSWPQPPCPRSLRGIELMRSEVERARRALGARCAVTQADIRSTAFGSADAIVMLDVLHYMPEAAQRAVLRRVRAALPRGGMLLLRVGDAAAGLRFRITQCSDGVILLLRGHGVARQHCHSIGRWRELLQECGFDSRPEPISAGTPFANVLLIARAV